MGRGSGKEPSIVSDTPPEPLNVLFDTNSLVLSWGNPGRPNDDEVLKIEKFLILAETLPLYPIPPLMQPWPQDKTYLQPDPFWPIEAVSKAPKGFVKIAGRNKLSLINSVSFKKLILKKCISRNYDLFFFNPEAGPEARRMNLSNFIVGYNTMRFKVVSVNAIGPSPPSPPTEDLVIPQSRPKMVVKNIRAGHALRAATKRLLAVAFDVSTNTTKYLRPTFCPPNPVVNLGGGGRGGLAVAFFLRDAIDPLTTQKIPPLVLF